MKFVENSFVEHLFYKVQKVIADLVPLNQAKYLKFETLPGSDIQSDLKHTFKPTAAKVSVTSSEILCSGMLEFSYLSN